ncbi:MAG: hypothetical protein ACTSWX_03270 [Promethearchaeota archaeon]
MVKMKIAWNSVPVENEIINALIDNRGEMLTTDLQRKLSNMYEDFTRVDLMKHLFRLEVRSYIHVVSIKKDVSKVEINKNGQFSDQIRKKIKTFMH